MLASFIDKIVSLKENKIHEINGETYSVEKLHHVSKHIPSPECVRYSTLSSIVTMVKAEIGKIDGSPLFVHVEGFDKVKVYTSYRDEMTRAVLYSAAPDIISPCNQWLGHEEAIISLKSRYIENEDSEYLLGLLSRISLDNSATSLDNGISQTVEVHQGISLKAQEQVRPRVTLRPYRTFFDVEQPESEFILRVREGGEIRLIEADGGMWKITAIKSIKDYFEFELSELIKDGKVVIVG